MFERGIDWRASLAALRQTNLSCLSALQRVGWGVLDHSNKRSPEMSETVELTSTDSHVLASSSSGQDLVSLLSRKVVGQSAATNIIVPYVYMYQSGLAPAGRPAGVFLLLGPTGTGKTRTVKAIADLLDGSEKHLLKIDCGEFQLDHETAKLIGAPPHANSSRHSNRTSCWSITCSGMTMGCNLVWSFKGNSQQPKSS